MAAAALTAAALTAAAGAPGQELLHRLREGTARWLRRERERLRVDAGTPELNRCLAGGWPVGKVGEVVGVPSSGRTTAAVAAVAAATRRGEVAAWVEAGDAFDPPSAAAAGVDLQRVLWVRVQGAEGAVRAAEIVLEVGGVTVVVVDLVGARPAAGEGRLRPGRRGASAASLRLRLARAAEGANAVVLVVAEAPWAGSLAGAAVVLTGRGGCWAGGEGGSPVWLAGVELHPVAEGMAGGRGGWGRAG